MNESASPAAHTALQVLRKHRFNAGLYECQCQDGLPEYRVIAMDWEDWTEHVAELIAEATARKITTAEELDGLPVGTVIRCVRARTPEHDEIFRRTANRRAPWLHLDPSDRQDDETTLESGHVLRWYGDLSVTVLHPGTILWPGGSAEQVSSTPMGPREPRS
ncbi:hypothetical protein D477_014246 [Arthrobacter crystallopoietes BAB-32]|uniref:Uncharacterized protein n=1 Tax=Arthrobacter crystallopoietes BAB-32 TaxID=1246476 RepID=N1V0J8_9MICC|nr:hypothetical protein [Arthrobacter crystallopoietes]EMY33569.1 hypothetical protein D477_014246 [Arthrobacter crystallopoietes BAB-32]